MKKKLLLIILTTLLLVIVAPLIIDDGWIYSAVGLIALTIVVAIRRSGSEGIKITRWAKANPRKTQVLIGLVQILIVAIALIIGYDLKELGYKLSDVSSIIFGVVLVSAFFFIPFLPRQNIIAIPAEVNKSRVVYMSIAVSAFVILVFAGNRIEDKFPNSPISLALRSIDNGIFGNSFVEGQVAFELNQEKAMLVNERSSMLALASTTGSEVLPKKEAREKIKAERKAQKLEKKKKRMMKRIEKLRKMFAAGATIGTVLLIITLIFTSCAGVCLIAIGGSAGAVILGIVLLAASVWGFVKIFQRKQRIKTG